MQLIDTSNLAIPLYQYMKLQASFLGQSESVWNAEKGNF